MIDHQDCATIARSHSSHEYLSTKTSGYHIAPSTRILSRFLIKIFFRCVIHLSPIWLLMAASDQQGYELYVISISIIANPISDDVAIVIIIALTSKYSPCVKLCRDMPYCCVVVLPQVLQGAIYPDNRPEIPKKGVEGNGRMLRVQYFFQFSSDEQPQTGKQRKLDKFIIVVQLVSKRKRWQSRKLHKWQTRPGLKNLRSLPSFRKSVPYWRLLSEARSPWMLSSSPLVERLC